MTRINSVLASRRTKAEEHPNRFVHALPGSVQGFREYLCFREDVATIFLRDTFEQNLYTVLEG